MRRFAAFIVAALAAPAVYASDPILPDAQLTPGAVLTTDAATVCRPGYAKSVRHTSGRLKAKVYRAYGIDRKGGHYEVDHLISLELGGADVQANLWPESYDTQPWNARTKDRLENFLHREVCAGRMTIEEAQREIAADWIGAYRKYLGEPGIAGGGAPSAADDALDASAGPSTRPPVTGTTTGTTTGPTPARATAGRRVAGAAVAVLALALVGFLLYRVLRRAE